MKKKEFKELKNREIKELEKKVDEKRSEFLKIKISIKSSGEKNLKKARILRKEIAQILTLIKEKEIYNRESLKEENNKKES